MASSGSTACPKCVEQYCNVPDADWHRWASLMSSIVLQLMAIAFRIYKVSYKASCHLDMFFKGYSIGDYLLVAAADMMPSSWDTAE